MIPLLQILGGAGGVLQCEHLTTGSSTADASTYTFSGLSLGASAADRWIAVAISARKAAPSATLSSVTVAGVSATIHATVTADGNAIALALAHVPAGTTGAVVVTWSTTVLRTHVALWRVTGATPTVLDTKTGSTTAWDATISRTLTTARNGVIIAASMSSGSVDVTHAWTGVTEQYDGPTIESFTRGSGGAAATSTGSVTVTNFSGVYDPAGHNRLLTAISLAPA